jgi:hypothetical protein
MIKLKNLLLETQTFNFNKSKSQIMQLIKKVKTGEAITKSDNPFYTILRNDYLGNVGTHKTMGFRDDAPKQWKKFFSSSFFNWDGVWSQRSFNSNKRVKKDGKTYNFYITVDRSDKENVARFANNYLKLDDSLKKLADTKGVAISYKTHAILDVFLTDNDSLKVYYYDSTDPSLKSEIENTVRKWANDNNVKLGNRSHEHGIDIEGRGSYGQILSEEILNVFINVVKNNPNHTDEEYYQWLVKHFVDIIRSIKVK